MSKKIKVYIKTYGCTLNHADTERMKGFLNTDKDIVIVNNQKDCDIEIINSCTVKNTAEQKLYREIRNAESKGKKVVVAGCVPQAEKSLIGNKLKKYPIVGPNNIKDIKKLVRRKGIFLENKHKKSKLKIRTLSLNKYVSIIPISEGCIGNCSYCKTKQARGDLSSYPEKDIVAIAEKAIKKGAKELWLTAQDTSCYGFDISRKAYSTKCNTSLHKATGFASSGLPPLQGNAGVGGTDSFTHKTNLAKLVKKIIKIKGDFKVRVGMGNPNSFLEVIDDYLPLFKSKKLYKFFHIPVQSGSDKVLKDMNRFYSVKDFKKLITIIRKNIKNAFIATDIIVGYSNEDEKDFQKSLSLIKWLKPDMLNISRMWLRKGTPAQIKHKQLPTKLVKERSQEMTTLFHEILDKNNKKWKNWKGKIIITEKGKNNFWIGKNEFYKQVIIKSDNLKIGDVINCKTKSLGRFEIVGEKV